MQDNYMNKPPGQRPLMKKKPAQVQSVVSCSSSNENKRNCMSENVVHLQKQVTLQVKAILIRFLPLCEVAYTEVKMKDFETKFEVIVKKNFEETIIEIQRSIKNWALDTIIKNIFFTDYECTLETESQNDRKFVFTPLTEQVSPSTQNPDAARNQNPTIIITTPENPSLARQLSDLIIGTNPSASAADAKTICEKQNHIPLDLMSYAAKMFIKPTWTWLNDEAREQKRDRVVEFFKFVQDTGTSATSNESNKKRAKNLAQALWASSIQYFPHVLYLLRQLRARRPNGFELLNFESEIEVLIPESWRAVHSNISFNHFFPESSKMVLLNMLMCLNENDHQLVEVNTLVDYLEFHEVSDSKVSIIYHFLCSMSERKTTIENIHKYLCQFYEGWADKYNEVASMKEIERICVENKMFSMVGNEYKARTHSYNIVLPMYFLPLSIM